MKPQNGGADYDSSSCRFLRTVLEESEVSGDASISTAGRSWQQRQH